MVLNYPFVYSIFSWCAKGIVIKNNSKIGVSPVLIKERLLFVKDNEHEFENLIEVIKDRYELDFCGYDYSTIKCKAMNMDSDHIICSMEGIEKNDFWNMVPSLPKLTVLYKECNIEQIRFFNDKNIGCYFTVENDKSEIERLFNIICSDVKYRYRDFYNRINNLIYTTFVINGTKYFEGYSLIVEAVVLIFFGDNRSVMSSGEIYRCVGSKADISEAAVEVALRRCIAHIWQHKEIFNRTDLLTDIIDSPAPPTNTKFLYAVADRLFFKYRSDFYRYYEAMKNDQEKSGNR